MSDFLSRNIPASDHQEAVKAFLEEIVAVSKKHELSLSHEDYQGAFQVEKLKEHNIWWLLNAIDKTQEAQ